MDFWDTVWGLLVAFILAMALLFGAIIGITYPLSSYSCTRTADAMGLEHQYGLWTDCLVKTPGGRWMSLERYQAIAVDNADQ